MKRLFVRNRDQKSTYATNVWQCAVLPGIVHAIADHEIIADLKADMIGMRHPVHVLELGADVQEIVNMTAVAVMDAQSRTAVTDAIGVGDD